MSFHDFKYKMYELGAFSIHQIYSWKRDFDSKNLVRWVKKGYLVKLRNGFYSFPEFHNVAGFNLFIANKIYKPSYISLQYALNFYGLIPEFVPTITSVSTLKTSKFENSFGRFSYQTILKSLYFGFTEKTIVLNERIVLFANLEKAILDLFYLYPFYNSPDEIEQLRFDYTIFQNIDWDLLNSYLLKFNNIALEKRINLVRTMYD